MRPRGWISIAVGIFELVTLLVAAPRGAQAQFIGFDPGMNKQCMWDDNVAMAAIDQIGCPGAPLDGPHWVLFATDGCGDVPAQIINVDGRNRPLAIYWGGGGCDPLYVRMDHGARATCGNETDLSIKNSERVPLVGLKAHHEVQMVGHGGYFQVSFALAFHDPGGTHRWLAVSLRPRNPLLTWGAVPGHIVYHGPGGASEICDLDAQWFGIPSLCPNGSCGSFQNVDIDWQAVLNDAIWNGCWPGLRGVDLSGITASYFLETAGYSGTTGGQTGSVTIRHRNWKMWR